MNAARLLRLADFLEQKVDSGRFNLYEFATDESFQPDVRRGAFGDCYVPTEVKAGCGTVACAVGWATAIPEFRKAGLRLFCDSELCHNAYPSFEDTRGWGAVKAFFDLEYDDAYYLFDPEYYPKSHKHKSYVIRRIRAFVKRGGRPKSASV